MTVPEQMREATPAELARLVRTASNVHTVQAAARELELRATALESAREVARDIDTRAGCALSALGAGDLGATREWLQRIRNHASLISPEEAPAARFSRGAGCMGDMWPPK